eukprot:1193685-Prorocentrum_minimum.AAC.2
MQAAVAHDTQALSDDQGTRAELVRFPCGATPGMLLDYHSEAGTAGADQIKWNRTTRGGAVLTWVA